QHAPASPEREGNRGRPRSTDDTDNVDRGALEHSEPLRDHEAYIAGGAQEAVHQGRRDEVVAQAEDPQQDDFFQQAQAARADVADRDLNEAREWKRSDLVG